MSADNCLLAIPARGGKVALYDVPVDETQRTGEEAKTHAVCARVVLNYPHRRIGVYANRDDAESAGLAYRAQTVVEFGFVALDC